MHNWLLGLSCCALVGFNTAAVAQDSGLNLDAGQAESLAIAMGLVAGHAGANQLGRSTDIDNGATADIWDSVSAGTGTIWTAPTQARIHAVTSNDAADAFPSGAGARTVRVYGLQTWDTAETSEVIELNGITAVMTDDSYVIVHRMEVLTSGATSINVGTLSAVAQVNVTLTAQINPGEGETQMAILGIPSIETAYMTSYYASVNKSMGAAGAVDISLLFNPEPDAELTEFLVYATDGALTTGTSHFQHFFDPYLAFPGPGILKVQATSGVVNADVSGGFDLIRVTNN